jgi:TRAP-type mannitol/chloroaromatic compound transport system permease small subunit
MPRGFSPIDSLNEWIGKQTSWFSTFLVILIFVDVVLRYLFRSTAVWVTELEWHFFAVLFLLGAAYTLKHDQHVRVDVFYAKFSDRRKAFILIYTSFKYALNSLGWNESSPDPGGLPARYIVKFVITLGFILLLLQALSLAVYSWREILKKEKP